MEYLQVHIKKKIMEQMGPVSMVPHLLVAMEEQYQLIMIEIKIKKMIKKKKKRKKIKKKKKNW